MPLVHDFWSEKTALARFAAERLMFLPHERDKSIRFQFSPAIIGADLSQHPAVLQADVIHLHWTTFGMLSVSGMQQLSALEKPIVWTMHDMWAFTGGCHYSRGCTNFETHCHHCPFLKRPASHDLSYRVFERKKAAFANAPTSGPSLRLVSPSEWLANLARKAALTNQFETHVIPNPIDTEVFKPTDKRAIRQKLGLPLDTPLLLFGSANTADPRKGFSYFAKALQLFPVDADTDLEGDKTGSGVRIPPSLHHQPVVLLFGKTAPAAVAALPFQVHSLGVLTTETDIVAAYTAADALVVPSLEDNLPNTIVESLACGTPVIAFSTGGIPEMIQHQKTGYLAQTGSATELADGLNWLLTQTPEQRSELSQNARQFAEAHYAEATVAWQYQQLYREVAQHESGKR